VDRLVRKSLIAKGFPTPRIGRQRSYPTKLWRIDESRALTCIYFYIHKSSKFGQSEDGDGTFLRSVGINRL